MDFIWRFTQAFSYIFYDYLCSTCICMWCLLKQTRPSFLKASCHNIMAAYKNSWHMAAISINVGDGSVYPLQPGNDCREKRLLMSRVSTYVIMWCDACLHSFTQHMIDPVCFIYLVIESNA